MDTGAGTQQPQPQRTIITHVRGVSAAWKASVAQQ